MVGFSLFFCFCEQAKRRGRKKDTPEGWSGGELENKK